MAMKTFVNTILLLFLFCSAGFADSPSSLVRQGNEAYKKEHYGEAIDKYNLAREARESDTGCISFNKGNSLFRQGKIDDAIEQYRDAANQSENDKLTSMAQFNLGNCFFNKAQQTEQEEPEQAVEDYQQSARCYRKALDLDKSDTQAAENISLTRRKIKQLKELLKQQQQQQQNQDNKDNKDKKDDKEDQQQDQQNQNSDKNDRQDKQNDQQQDQQSQQNQDQQFQQSDKQQQNQDQQQNKQDQQKQGQEKDQQTDQQQGSEQQKDQQQAKPGEQKDGEPKQEIKKKIELDPKAAKLIDQEKKRREVLLQLIKAQQKTVEKDW